MGYFTEWNKSTYIRCLWIANKPRQTAHKPQTIEKESNLLPFPNKVTTMLDRIHLLNKTRLFKYTENFTTKQMKIFR